MTQEKQYYYAAQSHHAHGSHLVFISAIFWLAKWIRSL